MFKEDESFWAHEWSKHGTCALDIFPSEYDYFKGTLDLHAKYDLQVRTHSTTVATNCCSRSSVSSVQQFSPQYLRIFGGRLRHVQ